MNQIQIKASLLFAAAFVLNSVNAQDGYSSASMHWGKMNAQQKTTAVQSGTNYFEFGMPRPQDIVVEEYFNYHHHNISLPKAYESVLTPKRPEPHSRTRSNWAVSDDSIARRLKTIKNPAFEKVRKNVV